MQNAGMTRRTNILLLGQPPDLTSIEVCLKLTDLLFAQMGAVANAELRKLLLRDVVERGVEALREQP